MDDENIDGESMPDSDDDDNSVKPSTQSGEPPRTEMSRREALAASIASKLGKVSASHEPPKPPSPTTARRRRPKAEDMFAVSDEE